MAQKASRCSRTACSIRPLSDRLWYGGGSRSAVGAKHGMNSCTSNVVQAEESEDFAEIQHSLISEFRTQRPERRAQGLVALPNRLATEEQPASTR